MKNLVLAGAPLFERGAANSGRGIGELIRRVERDWACAGLELDSGEKHGFLSKTWHRKHTPLKLTQMQGKLNDQA